MLSRSLLILPFVFISFITALAQGQFQPGYVVVNPSDTLRGYIHNKDWDISPTQIAFKKDLSQEEQIFTAEQVSAFYIETDHILYESRSLKLLIVTEGIYKSVPKKYYSQTLFIQRIWTNELVSLYRAKSSKDEEERFFISQPNQFYELINFKYGKIEDGKQYKVLVEDYKEQLAQLTAGTPGFSLPAPSFSSDKIIKYLNKYNEKRSDQKKVTQITNPKSAYYVGFGAGIERLSIYDGERKDNYMTAGLTFRVHTPRKNHNRFMKLNYYATPASYYYNYYTGNAEKRMSNALDLAAGSYIGQSNLQPFFTVGLGIYWLNVPKSSKVYFPPVNGFFPQISAGISYKKKFELEVSHFAHPIFIFWFKALPFLPPRISLNYYIKIK